MDTPVQKLVAATLILSLVAGAGPRAAAAQDACDRSGDATTRACREDVRSERSIALAKCLNLPDPVAQDIENPRLQQIGFGIGNGCHEPETPR